MYSSPAVAEIVPTIQGEIRVGEPVILVRLNGCNYHCPWCDTKYTWINKSKEIPQLTDDDIDAVLDEFKKYPKINKILLTGGEPLLYANQDKFYELLNIENFNILHIETNGSLLNTPDFHISNWSGYTIINISPKFEQIPDSEYEAYINIVKKFVYDQWVPNVFDLDMNLKFVYNKKNESKILNMVADFEDVFGTSNNIHVMSQTPDLSELRSTYIPMEINQILINNDLETIKFCMKHGFNFTPRFHTYLFHGDRKEMSE